MRTPNDDELDGRIPLRPDQVNDIANLINHGVIHFDPAEDAFSGSVQGLLRLTNILTGRVHRIIH